jgi:hexosaminidase
VSTIKETIDGMSFTKLNVLHWHLVDAESFPYESKTYPKLSKFGAYSQKAVYAAQNVQDIVQYARRRAVLVLPEIDTPGHTAAFAKGHPEVVSQVRFFVIV